jgi:glyoxylase-like metal-dependent hydrolase (beta-lactamase superfamily II)/rhodanese-related sulfurtransferase
MQEKIMTVAQLQNKLNKHENVFILDVRPGDQRKEWKIADSVHVDAYKQLNAGDNTALDMVDVPHGSTVVTVCAAGRTSLIASNLLRSKGVDAYSLQGGMKAWNFAWNTAEVMLDNSKVIQIRRPAKGVLSYMIGSSDEAVVIDASLEPGIYQRLAKENGWVIKYVMDTHIHADYVSRTRELAKASGAKHLMIDIAKVAFDVVALPHRSLIRFGESQIEFIHTPGHTWESTSFKLGINAIVTGDTLFVDGIGRPDLKADKVEGVERAKALFKSLQELISMDSAMLVLPGHTSSTVNFDNKLIAATIAKIKPEVQALDLSEADFIEYSATRIPATPPNYLSIASINKNGSHEGQVLADLEAGGNHCAIA